MHSRLVLITLVVCVSQISDRLLFAEEAGEAMTREQEVYFETHIRPLLANHCFECHGSVTQKGGLRLDTRAGAFGGGDSGPAISPGEIDVSPLIEAVRYAGLEMPPRGKLSADLIESLETWVERGAVWPADKDQAVGPTHGSDEVTAADREHWAFKPINAIQPPQSSTPLHPIDAYVEQKLTEQGLVANSRAATTALIYRVYFGLTGLPPTHQELISWEKRLGGTEGFAFDPVKYRAMIDELLGRTAYGEHWARHWLDVVRFAQSNGYERDGYKPSSWRYRDYVIQAFQNDVPYDRFILEQLAGDELADSDEISRTATGFYRLGVWDDEPDDARQAEFDELDDVMVTIGASFMGLTIGCARCHSHKFDPIPQADYYRLLSFLRNVRRYERPQENLNGSTMLPLGTEEEIRAAHASLVERRKERENLISSAATDEARKRIESQPLDESLRGVTWTLGVRERQGDPIATHVLIRGDASTPGKEVLPGFLEVLSHTTRDHNGSVRAEGKVSSSASNLALQVYQSESPLDDLMPSSGRRLALARWIADTQNPLTARVMVNRVWHYHFGRGIVETTADFGRAGTPPSHPELLDWLADDFMRSGWSVKHLHRTILTSETYMRSSSIDSKWNGARLAVEVDPGNRLLWRSALRRLDAEAIRDRMLFASGELNQKLGGPEMYPQLSGEVLAGQSRPGLDWQVSKADQRARRSVYAVVKRGVRDPLLQAFDYSNVSSPLTERPTTTVAPQALMLLHSRFTEDRASHLAERVTREFFDKETQIHEIYRSILGRNPTKKEVSISADALHQFTRDYQSQTGIIRFRPDVPVSLYGDYRRTLPAEQFLIGPETGWNYYQGRGGGAYEGIEVVDERLGPFALWQGQGIRDGQITGMIRFEPSVESLTLLGRAVTDGDSWRGSAITLNRKIGEIEARDRVSNDHEKIVSAKADIPAGIWIPFRWELNGEKSSAWFAELSNEEPTIEQILSSQNFTRGQIGIAVWGGQVEFKDLCWKANPAPASVQTQFGSDGAEPIDIA
ncbi:MAG: PSD1 domain-containing protein, partial [Rubripirellula sp.]|nr:PSD1 domain-containing protein [Rubripirellula sp.]